jgi:hypothetical protein
VAGTCSGEEAPAAASRAAPEPMRWHVGATYGATWSRLTIGGQSADIARRSVSASVELRPSSRWTVSLGGGAAVAGDLVLGARRFTLDPGWIAAVAGSYRILDGTGASPFLIASVALSASGARSREDATGQTATFTTTDARGALTVGKIFWNAFGPFASVRGFGSPAIWTLDGKGVTGTDDYHYQVAVGVVAAVKRLDVFAELAPLGEKAVTVGAGYAF